MKILIGVTFILSLYSCSHLISKKSIENKPNNNCIEILKSLETNLFLSCPISESPDSVISYLAKQPTFIRNKEYDFGNGSVRFNAKNASFLQYNLVDQKSVFLLNYFNNENGKPTFFLFQAIYYFKNEGDKNQVYEKMIHLLDNQLKLLPEVMYDLNSEAYLRYYLPCGSGINLKQSKNLSDKSIIDILWYADVTK